MVEAARNKGIYVRGGTSCTLRCPYEGEIDPSRVAMFTVLMKDIDVGTPIKVRRALEATLRHYGLDDISGHFHDTYGQALGNTLASFDMGVWQYDTSSAGLGGCP